MNSSEFFDYSSAWLNTHKTLLGFLFVGSMAAINHFATSEEVKRQGVTIEENRIAIRVEQLNYRINQANIVPDTEKTDSQKMWLADLVIEKTYLLKTSYAKK